MINRIEFAMYLIGVGIPVILIGAIGIVISDSDIKYIFPDDVFLLGSIIVFIIGLIMFFLGFLIAVTQEIPEIDSRGKN